jgi:predicted TIM-barrel fold metal-dependent hydrolase
MEAASIAKYFLKLKEANNIEGICIHALPTTLGGPIRALQNLRALHVKDLLGDYAHAFMGLVHDETAEDYLTQLKKGMAQGFEGLKILETKTDVQKKTGIHICDEKFDPVFSYMEEMGIPCLMHVGDPPEHWDIEKIDKWSLEHGRYYGDGSFLSREELYGDVEQMLTKHPKLKVIFAHFYFLSTELDRAFDLFERFPEVRFDLTPGKEMFENFGKNLDKAREFFTKYADRIYFGTDVHDEEIFDYHCKLYDLVNTSLEGTCPFDWYDYHCAPLDLPAEILKMIKEENFLKLLGKTPKEVNRKEVIKEIHRLSGLERLLCDEDKAELLKVKEYFFKQL